MSKHQTIVATWLVAIIDQLALLGLPRDELIDAACPKGELPSSPTQQLELVTARRLWRRASELSDDSLLGLKVGANLPPQTMNVLALLVMHSKDLRSALQQLVRYQTLISNSGRFAVTPTADGGAIARYTVAKCHLPMHPMQLDSIFASWIMHIKRCGDAAMRPLCIRLPKAGRSRQGEYTNMLGCPVEFSAGDCAEIVYSASALNARFPGADPPLHELLCAHAETMRKSLGTTDSLVTSIRALARTNGFNGISCGDVAQAMDVSTRTLQRRLTGMGLTFRRLIEDARMEEALVLLRTGTLSLQQVSAQLGYSEPSSFSHAVRAYWGATPRELRTGRVE